MRPDVCLPLADVSWDEPSTRPGHHGGAGVPTAGVGKGCCDRCADALPHVGSRPSAVARRPLLKAAIFRPHQSLAQPAAPPVVVRPGVRDQVQTQHEAAHTAAPETTPARAVSGTVLDISPQVLVLGDSDNEQRLVLTPEAVAWRGAAAEPAALRPGDRAVVRLRPGSGNIADRIWANIGRVTGIIVERAGGRIVVDEGTTRKRQVVIIQPRVAGRIQVRFPTLEPGYLIDIIGLRREDELDGLIPATSQPTYPADQPPAPPLISRAPPQSAQGSATWHEPHEEPADSLGVCYPALDPQARCAEDAASGTRHGYARLPYLAIGSTLRVTNQCNGQSSVLPVTGCATIARLFNDRCVTCGTSPRGRIADLTLATFVALGGELERGCFNATIAFGP